MMIHIRGTPICTKGLIDSLMLFIDSRGVYWSRDDADQSLFCLYYNDNSERIGIDEFSRSAKRRNFDKTDLIYETVKTGVEGLMSFTGYSAGSEDPVRCCVNFNQDFTTLCVGTRTGYRLYTLNVVDSLDQVYDVECGEVSHVERLFASSLVAVVASSSPCTLRICHFTKRNEICTYNYSSPILSVHLNRQRLVVCLESCLFIHNIRDMKVLHRICDTPRNLRGMCALSAGSSSAGDALLAYPGSCEVGQVQIFDAIALRALVTVPAHNSSLAALAFNSQANLIATASEKGTVIRVFSVPEGVKLYDFRRGVKRCAVIHSLSFSLDSLFLACTSNTETVHVFQLDCPTDRTPGDGGGSGGWMDYFGQALRTSVSYLPTQVSEVLSQSRDFAVAKLPTSGIRSVCAIASIQKTPRLLVATEDGFLFVYSIEPLATGSECILLKQHRIDGRDEKVATVVPRTSSSAPPCSPSRSGVTSATSSTDSKKSDSSSTGVRTPPRVSSQNKLSYASVVSTQRRDGPHECRTCDDFADQSSPCQEDTGYCTPAEELQVDWSGDDGTLRLDDDKEFPAVTRLFA